MLVMYLSLYFLFLVILADSGSGPSQPKTVLEALEQRMAKYKEAFTQAKASGDDRKARMHDRIAKVNKCIKIKTETEKVFTPDVCICTLNVIIKLCKMYQFITLCIVEIPPRSRWQSVAHFSHELVDLRFTRKWMILYLSSLIHSNTSLPSVLIKQVEQSITMNFQSHQVSSCLENQFELRLSLHYAYAFEFEEFRCKTM